MYQHNGNKLPIRYKAIINQAFVQRQTPGLKSTYRFQIGDYKCNLVTLECLYRNPQTNVQCKRQVSTGLPLCWQHAKSVYKLRIGQTRLHGFTFRGLFACDSDAARRHEPVFKAKEIICPYIGKVVRGTEQRVIESAADREWTRLGYNQRYAADPIVPYQLHTDTKNKRNKRRQQAFTVDSACVRGIGSFANAASTRAAANGDIKNTLGWPSLRAIKPIYNGDEILLDYGPDHDLYINQPDISKTVPRLKINHQACR